MSNGSMPMKGSPSSRTADHLSSSMTCRINSANSSALSDLSLLVQRYQQDQPEILTDDDDDEAIDTSDDEDSPITSSRQITSIDLDTQTKLATILQATGLTNDSIPEDFWRDPEVVRLLTGTVTNHLNRSHERSSPTNKDTSKKFLSACLTNDLRSVEKLLRTAHGQDHLQDVNDDGESILAFACSHGYIDLVRLLLNTIPNIDVDDRGTKQDCTPLMEACNAGHYEIVELLLNRGANVNIQSSAGNSALHFAAGGGYVNIVRLLLKHGAKVEETNENGHTPLMEAASGGHVDVARALLDSGAGVNTHSPSQDAKQHKNDEMHTALMEACMDGHVQVAKLLLDHGADVNMPPDSYESPLTLSACGGHMELAALLIDRGANLEEVNDEGYTPLMEASREGHDDLVNLLISRDANVNRTTEDTQETALTLACAGGFLNVAKALLDHGANINLGQSTALMEASQEGHSELVRYLISKGADIHRKTRTGDTALAYACESGHTEIAEILLNAGAHVDQADNEGRTPLMKAARLGHIEAAKYLISKGAVVNRSTNSNDATVLSLSCAGGHFELASILLKQGANPNHLLKDRSTCLIEASKNGHASIVHLLLEYPKGFVPRPVNAPPAPKNPEKDSDEAQQQLQVNKEYRQPMIDHTNSNSTISGKKKRTTSSSSTSSSSSQDKLDELSSENKVTLPVLSPTINFFSTSPVNSRLRSKTHLPSFHSHHYHHHYPKFKRSLHRSVKKVEARSSSMDHRTKFPMRINTDTQKALEHLRELASHPSTLERIQSLTNHPTLIEEIKKKANQSFTEQLRSLPPFTSSNLSTTVTPIKTNVNPAHLRFANRIDVDCQTDSNHDTALTLSCIAGHEELIRLLLQRGANVEHRDKKGFTPLILAATAGHANIVARLLDHGANIEALSERTKDTVLSLACSGGRQEVVEVLLKKGANREHRNVSDYTALSLAASSGHLNIIRLLLNAGADVNSRTGSKLGITPLMLASMNGHVAAVKLLLDMGADINAQIETNRNTALTLACFQGRTEVVSLLVDRKANIEHRAKTGLTPLMESASGGYVDVGRVLLEHGADVNASPVLSSKDTALTIAADKGHQKFVELLLAHGATIDVRNKKSATPLWLACNNGHSEVVQLLVTRGADPDTSDSRKVPCLMAAFRRGHVKVVKYLVRQIRQLPSDADCHRLINTITDKDLQKKCQACMDEIISAKEQQAAEANKAANSLLQEIDLEKSREETRKVAAAKKREKRKAKKKGKQQPTTTTDDQPDESTTVHVEEEKTVIEEIPPVEPPSTIIAVEVPDEMTNQSKPKPVLNPNPKKKDNTLTQKMERSQTVATVVVDDGWQQVIGKQKKMIIPHEHYHRIIGRGGANLHVLSDVTGASTEIENKRAVGDKILVIKGHADAIKHAHQLIMALLKSSESELTNLLPPRSQQQGKTRSMATSENDDAAIKPSRTSPRREPPTVSNQSNRSPSSQPLTVTGATWVNSNRSNRATLLSLTNKNPSTSMMNSQHSQTTKTYSSTHSKAEPSISPDIGHPPSQSTSNSLLVVPSTINTPTNEYNPFASNILTTSLVDVLTKPKDISTSTEETHSNGTNKMNFANVAKMRVPPKNMHQEPITITTDESVVPMANPKVAPGYRGMINVPTVSPHSPSTLMSRSNYDTISPTSQLSRAPGAHRRQPSISPSFNQLAPDQHGLTGSSSTSSTSSSPSSFLQPTKPFGPIGSHRLSYDPNLLEDSHQSQMKFHRTLSTNNPPVYSPSTMTVPTSPYIHMSQNRSNLNPGAPEFQQPFNGSLSANIHTMAQMMEPQQHHVPPSPQLPTTLEIANILASQGQLPADPNEAASLVAAYYYTHFISPAQTATSFPSSHVNSHVYEMNNLFERTNFNRDEVSFNSVDTINSQSILIMTNSNPSPGPSPITDHKMVPAAIGSERKRHISTPSTTNTDWSSIGQQFFPINAYVQGQIPYSFDYSSLLTQTRDLTR